MADSLCINLEPAIIFFPFFKHTPIHFFYKNKGRKPHFSEKSGIYPYKTWILPHKPPLFSKGDFHDKP